MLTMTREQLSSVRDDLYVLECAIADVRRDLAAGIEGDDVREALEWLLASAEPVVAAHSRL